MGPRPGPYVQGSRVINSILMTGSCNRSEVLINRYRSLVSVGDVMVREECRSLPCVCATNFEGKERPQQEKGTEGVHEATKCKDGTGDGWGRYRATRIHYFEYRILNLEVKYECGTITIFHVRTVLYCTSNCTMLRVGTGPLQKLRERYYEKNNHAKIRDDLITAFTAEKVRTNLAGGGKKKRTHMVSV